MRKKGQAAMEFLMTYGWAILAAIIVVGVLWYLIGNPANLAGDRFTIGAPLIANAMSLTNETVSIEFRNGHSEKINVTAVRVEGCNMTYNLNPHTPVAAGNLQSFIVFCSPVLSVGSRFDEAITILYRVGDGALDQQTSGKISGRVQSV